MICWANENWTKRWDGKDKDVIVAQKYLPSDPLNFIKDVEKILLDKRYIKIDGKIALSVYRPEDLDDPKKYTKVWRDYFRKTHKTELHLISIMGFKNSDPYKYGFDAAIDFVPQGIDFKVHAFEENRTPQVDIRKKLLDVRFEGLAYDYRRVVLNEKFHQEKYPFKVYKCVMPSWDNDARKKGKGAVFFNESPDLYGRWLQRAIEDPQTKESGTIFLNAWNEWAEGTTLEPTKHYGHAILNRTSEVLALTSRSSKNITNFPMYGIHKSKETKLAVVLHLYYTEQWDYIRRKLSKINEKSWDLFVNLQEKDEQFTETIFESYPKAHVVKLPNRGRDVLPFMHIVRRLNELGYSSVLKLHTKKSPHRNDGANWLSSLTGSLLPNKISTRKLVSVVNEGGVFIGPKGHYISLKSYMGSNQDNLRAILERVYDAKTAEQCVSQPNDFAYFAGSMFWASMDVLRPLANLHLMPEDFEPEAGQIDGTMAHAIERAIGIILNLENAKVYQSGLLGIKAVKSNQAIINYKYAS
jgi:lipopolysaccharide biosynthesis protein